MNNSNGKGFTRDFLKLMTDIQKACCGNGNNLFSITTEDTNTVQFSGKGTLKSPLTAIAIGGGGAFGINGVSTDGDGNLVLGNDVGDTTAILVNDREIPLNNFSVNFNGTTGSVTIENHGLITLSSNLDSPWQLTTRGIGLGFPVPTMRPAVADKQIAFDVMPNGDVSGLSPGSSIAWIDVCDTDIYETNDGTVNCARLGVNTNSVDVGSIGFGSGNVLKPLRIIMGENHEVGRVNIDSTVRWTTNDFKIQKDAVDTAVIQWILNHDAGESAELLIIGQTETDATFGFLRFENAGVAPDSYIQPLQFEIVANVGATNGIVIGALAHAAGLTAPIKFWQNRGTALESARFSERQNFLIGTSVDNPAALINMESVTKGLLLPRMTTTQKNAIVTPPEGLEVYDLTLHKKCVFTGTVWETITSV